MTAPPSAGYELDSMRAVHDPRVAGLKLAGCFAWTLLLAPIQGILLGLGAVAWSRRNARYYWRGIAAILGMRLIVHGTPPRKGPVLFVANHSSYLDIVALGAVVDAAFIAKSEIRHWPGINIVAKLGRTVFVDRRPRQSKVHRDDMLERLAKTGESLILFPEGTSHDGNLVRAFKSALFAAASVDGPDGRKLAVQPMSVAYTRLDGMPLGRGWRPMYTWFGDMDLAPHLWNSIGLGNVTVEIEFHPVTSLDALGSRKALSDHCFKLIATGLSRANAGRLPEPAGLLAKPI